MNKIILDKKKIIDLYIENDSICNIGKDYDIEVINIKILDNIKFVINHYSEIISNRSIKINIEQNNNSEFIYNCSFINEKKYDVNINVNMCGDNSKNSINIKGISNSGISNIVIDGSVCSNTIDNELYESIKMLNIMDGKSNILPNMYINTKNVVANHAASVTNINEEYLFYLNSKGISDSVASTLIIDGFLENSAR